MLDMKRFFRKLIALPIRLLAVVLGWIKIFNPEKLWSAAWKLSGNSEDGCTLISYMCKKQITEEARKTAEEIIAQTKDCSAAALMGFWELHEAEGTEAAKKWVDVAVGHNCINLEMMLYLKLLISVREGRKMKAS